MTEAPSRVPPEATRDAIEAQRSASLALTRIYAMGLFVVNLAFVVLLATLGVQDEPTFDALLVTGFGAAILIGLSARGGRGAGAIQTLGYVLLCVANGILTRWLSPWVIVPMTMFINTMSLTFFFGSRIVHMYKNFGRLLFATSNSTT